MNVSPWLKKHARVYRSMSEAIEAINALPHVRMVYLAGPINGCSDEQCRGWREAAKMLLKPPTLDPMARDYRGVEDENADAIVEGDLADIRACGAILANVAKASWGTAMEIRAAAAELGVPVFSFMEIA